MQSIRSAIIIIFTTFLAYAHQDMTTEVENKVTWSLLTDVQKNA